MARKNKVATRSMYTKSHSSAEKVLNCVWACPALRSFSCFNMEPGVNSSKVTTRLQGVAAAHGRCRKDLAKTSSMALDSRTVKPTRRQGSATGQRCSPPCVKGNASDRWTPSKRVDES